MFSDFLKAYDLFREYGTENPLLDTLRLVDFVSRRRLSKIDVSLLREDRPASDRRKEKGRGACPSNISSG